MRYDDRSRRGHGTRESLDMARKAAAAVGVRPPDTVGPNYLKWDRSDGGYVIFRAYQASWGTLDIRWLEQDGLLNGPFAPIEYDSIPLFVRDLRVMLDDGPKTRTQLQAWGRREPTNGN